MTEQEVIKIVTKMRENFETAKLQKAQLEGRWQEVTTNLKAQHGVSSVKEAHALQQKLVTEHDAYIATAVTTLQNLKEKHGSSIFP